VHLGRGPQQGVQRRLAPDDLGGGGEHARRRMGGTPGGGGIDDGDTGTEAAQVPGRRQADDSGPDDDDVHGFSLRRHDPHQVWRSALMPSQPRSEAPANFLYSMTMTTDIPPHTDVSESLRASRQARLARASLYLCTDARSAQGDLAEFLDAAYTGGVDIIQLRDKTLEARAEIAALEVLKECSRAAREAVLRQRPGRCRPPDRRRRLPHVGQGDLTSAQARAVLGDDVILGRSTHSRDQALAAEADGEIDYFCVGPVWQTPTKPGRRAVGTQLLTEVAAEAGKPWFAIGGIAAGPRLDEIREAGAKRAVVVRAITSADDPAAAARDLKEELG
jgi:thiamine-phosphate pyrophosphorylase